MQNYVFFQPVDDHSPQDSLVANSGSWAQEQNLAYSIFVDIHKKSMTSKKKMREMQFYDKLAAFIGSRTSSQCRSHHQKMFDKFKYISKIVETFKLQVGVTQYKAKFEAGLQKMKEINQRFALEALPEDHPGEEDQPNGPISPRPASPIAMPPLTVLAVYFNPLYIYGGDSMVPFMDGQQGYYFCPDY